MVMAYRIFLFEQGKRDQPDWWYNYIQSFNNGLVPLIDEVNEDLVNYNAEIRMDEVNPMIKYLDFESEEHYSIFVLRWS